MPPLPYYIRIFNSAAYNGHLLCKKAIAQAPGGLEETTAFLLASAVVGRAFVHKMVQFMGSNVSPA